jgi:hypothetical protein
MIKQFRKRPVVIEAIQWNGNTNRDEIIKFVGKELRTEEFATAAWEAGQGPPFYSLIIETIDGDMEAAPGDWIVKEPFPTEERTFYPVKPEIFEKTYEPI